jgi:hypothetical protein
VAFCLEAMWYVSVFYLRASILVLASDMSTHTLLTLAMGSSVDNWLCIVDSNGL